ncbi:MAG: hypothetical protein E2O68_06320 [Deltaproteobacteria bacterium]|nr:MAG: hypothetical protein E2O68_06320 [Deltaproteobacteria bacterium]
MFRIVLIFILVSLSAEAKINYPVAIEQNMVIFCMKNRKHPKLRNDDICKSYTYKALYRCQRVSRASYKLLKCIKKSLRI